MKLDELARAVKTREDLQSFVNALVKDLAKGKWENKDLASYLEGLAGFVGDLDGYYTNRGAAPPKRPEWRTLAEVLLAATMYE